MKFKVGDVVTPKPGTFHHEYYGSFIARVNTVESGLISGYTFVVLVDGKERPPCVKNSSILKEYGYDFHCDLESVDDEFEICHIYDSPLYRALL
jgi:hypothetical protein